MLTLETRKSVPKGKLRGNWVKSFRHTGGLHATFYWKWTLLVSRLVTVTEMSQILIILLLAHSQKFKNILWFSLNKNHQIFASKLEANKKMDTFSLLAVPLDCTAREIIQTVHFKLTYPYTPFWLSQLLWRAACNCLLKMDTFSLPLLDCTLTEKV